jgi:hypothetical protein
VSDARYVRHAAVDAHSLVSAVSRVYESRTRVSRPRSRSEETVTMRTSISTRSRRTSISTHLDLDAIHGLA